jgi:hypothetical protein
VKRVRVSKDARTWRLSPFGEARQGLSPQPPQIHPTDLDPLSVRAALFEEQEVKRKVAG